MRMNEIKVVVGEEYQVKISKEPVLENFFYEAYQDAAGEVKEIIQDTESFYENYYNNKAFRNPALDYSNNIIAFNGDRGQGKSSAMLSFSNFLEHCTEGKNKDFFDGIDRRIAQARYLVLPRIDPTKFEEKENILTVILAKLFYVFSTLWDKDNEKNISQKGEVLKQFEACYSEIDAIKNDPHEEEFIGTKLERLRRIGDSENLKGDFLKLIQLILRYYFRIIGFDYREDRCFVVIQLDDTDLDVKRAKEILEDVRKYFMIPNVIIIMAADINQLTYVIEQGYIDQFDKLESVYNENQPIKHHRNAVKYIDKLIPGKRNIMLPKLRAATKESVGTITLKYVERKKDASAENGFSEKNVLEFTDNSGKEIFDMQELVLQYIYKKTGIIFVKPTNYLHYIIPRTMRSLVNFLSILHQMPDIVNEPFDKKEGSNDSESKEGEPFSKEELSQRFSNLEVFEKYFLNIWIPNHVDTEWLHVVNNFVETPWTIKSKQLIRDIWAALGFGRDESTNPHQSIRDQLNEYLKITSDSMPIANVLKIMSMMENIFPEQSFFRFTFAIRTLYTINCNKIICNDLMNDLDAEEGKRAYGQTAILDFLGGDIFGDSAEHFVPREGQKYNRAVYQLKIERELNDYLKTIEKTTTFSTENEKKEFDSETKTSVLFLIALFFDFVFPSSESSKPDYQNSYKSRGNNVYSKTFKFNITHPLLYLYQPENAMKKVVEDPSTAENLSVWQSWLSSSDRFAAMNIISSMDLINRIRRDAVDYSLMRSQKWGYHEYIINFFERIEAIINKVSYLKLSCSFKKLKDYIEQTKEYLNFFFEKYKKEIDRELLMVSKIKRLQKTQSFEKLEQKIREISICIERIERIGGLEPIDRDEIRQLNKETMYLWRTIRTKHGAMSSDDRKDFQTPCNRIINKLNAIIEREQLNKNETEQI